jgi:hypothetical protein
MLVASGDDVFAGCVDSGRLVRIDASSGVVRAERASLGAFPISDVRALRGGVVVAGWTSSGAVMRYNAALLRRSDFSTLAELPQDTQFIGMAGAMAIFDDRCCNGRFDGPVTVMRYDVLRNVLSSPVALSRDPDPFRGMGATTAIVGSRLISSSIPYLDDYGDARAPRTTPQRLARGLVEPAMYLADGKIFEERRASDGRIDDEIRDIGHPEPRVVWRSDADAVPDYDPDSAREVVAFTDKPSKRPRHASSERPTARRSEATRRAAHSPPTATSSSPTVSIAISASTEQKRSGDTRYRRSLVVPHRHQPVKALE